MNAAPTSKPSAHPAVAVALCQFADAEQLARMIDQARCVSFDFFDTLFARPFLEPEFVFDLLGRREGVDDFRQKRVSAQTEAFRRMAVQGRKEIRLEDIYACFDAPADERARLADTETALELALLAPKPEVVALFQALRTAGVRLAICSDMYFSRAFFEEVLREHGMTAVEMLLVSADEDATKRDAGELFQVLIQMSGLPAHEILHIGDHALGDVQRAQEHGLMAFHYAVNPSVSREPAERAFTLHGLWERCKADCPQSDLRNRHGELFARLGFLYGGPANLGFLQWLGKQTKNDSIDHLLFLSRDGFVMERLAAQDIVSDLPEHSYFHGSRIAFYLAAMTEKNFSSYIPFLLSGSDGLSPHELLERIGVIPPDEPVMSDLGLGPDVAITQGMHPRVARFLYAWRGEILKTCAENRRALRLQLAKLGIQTGDKIGLVDVGWSGSTQEAFEAATQPWIDLSVTGYYLCLSDTEERKTRAQNQRMHAMVSSDTHGADFVSSIYAGRSIIEMFFSAPHPTIIGWQPDQHSGQVKSVMDEGRGGSTDALSAISAEINAAAEHFVNCYQTLSARIGTTLTPEELVAPLLHLTVHDAAQCRQFAAHVVNFDTWSSSKNYSRDLTAYA